MHTRTCIGVPQAKIKPRIFACVMIIECKAHPVSHKDVACAFDTRNLSGRNSCRTHTRAKPNSLVSRVRLGVLFRRLLSSIGLCSLLEVDTITPLIG